MGEREREQERERESDGNLWARDPNFTVWYLSRWQRFEKMNLCGASGLAEEQLLLLK